MEEGVNAEDVCIDHVMFSEEHYNYIVHGSEETNIEYKDSMNWSERSTKLKLLCAMLAMSNQKDGGVIVFGVKEDAEKNCTPAGMSELDFNTFNHDHVAQYIQGRSEPVMEFDLIADVAAIDGEERRFVLVQVRESADPTICTRTEYRREDIRQFHTNLALRANAVYIRSKSPIGSREIASTHEWRELINRLVEKNQDDLIRRIPWPQLYERNRALVVSDEDRFVKDLNQSDL